MEYTQYLSELSRNELLGYSATLLFFLTTLILALKNRFDKQKAQAKFAALEKENIKLSTILEQEQKFSSEKQSFYTSAHQDMAEHFSVIAQNIIEEKGTQINNQNSERITSLLLPLKEQLHLFKTEMSTAHHHQTKERETLRQEIIHLRNLNEQINIETANLTNALKGDNRIQGAWGELILEKVLESSGLRKDIEFSTQASFRDIDNHLFRPDALVHLPDGKDIIIDSKVSLTAWEKFVNEEDEQTRQLYLKNHTTAISNHIKLLSAKNYSELKGLNCLDFVLMFMPIESAISAVFQQNPSLYDDALRKNIIIVTPPTLLATVKTIANLWQREKQSRNSIEIADRATILYDKFRLFAEDLEKLGSQLSTSTKTYDKAMSKLCHGRGNLVSQTHKLTELGVRVKKELPDTILQSAHLDEKN